MGPPDRYSASPLPSFCTTTTRWPSPLAEQIKSIIRWWRGERPSFKQQIQQAKAVALLAEEVEAEADAVWPMKTTRRTPPKNKG
jgi:hypothetical protein